MDRAAVATHQEAERMGPLTGQLHRRDGGCHRLEVPLERGLCDDGPRRKRHRSDGAPAAHACDGQDVREGGGDAPGARAPPRAAGSHTSREDLVDRMMQGSSSSSCHADVDLNVQVGPETSRGNGDASASASGQQWRRRRRPRGHFSSTPSPSPRRRRRGSPPPDVSNAAEEPQRFSTRGQLIASLRQQRGGAVAAASARLASRTPPGRRRSTIPEEPSLRAQLDGPQAAHQAADAAPAAPGTDLMYSAAADARSAVSGSAEASHAGGSNSGKAVADGIGPPGAACTMGLARSRYDRVAIQRAPASSVAAGVYSAAAAPLAAVSDQGTATHGLAANATPRRRLRGKQRPMGDSHASMPVAGTPRPATTPATNSDAVVGRPPGAER